MKAIVVQSTGGPEVMQVQDVPVPVPAPGEVRVTLSAIGVNYIDTYHRSGQYSLPLPFTPGVEGAGIVAGLGQGVTDLSVGDRVVFTGARGAYAEAIAVPRAKIVRMPASLSYENAAAAMLQGLTAHYLTRSTFVLRPGQTALIHAAAGGVGQLLTQMAKSAGARVIGTVSSPKKGAIARAAGADETIDYAAMDFEAEVRRLTAGAGVDVVYDAVGRTTFDRSLRSLKPRGMLVLYGQASGSVPAFDPMLLARHGSLFLTRPNLAEYTATQAELEHRASEVFEMVLVGKLKLSIDRRFSLPEAGDAHRYLEARQSKGKVLLLPPSAIL